MTLGLRQTSIVKTQVHITPRWIIEILGPFDLDPAAADPRPWDCAAVNYTERDDGLRQPWFGRPFLNSLFDRCVVPSRSASSTHRAIRAIVHEGAHRREARSRNRSIGGST
jgi:hypothetical protein